MATQPHPHHHEPDAPETPGRQPVEPDEGSTPPDDPEQDGGLPPQS